MLCCQECQSRKAHANLVVRGAASNNTPHIPPGVLRNPVAPFVLQASAPELDLELYCPDCKQQKRILLSTESAATLLKALRPRPRRRKEASEAWLENQLKEACAPFEVIKIGHFVRRCRPIASLLGGMSTEELRNALRGWLPTPGHASDPITTAFSDLKKLLDALLSRGHIDRGTYLHHNSIIPLFSEDHATYIVLRQVADAEWHAVVCNGGAGQKHFGIHRKGDAAVFYTNNINAVEGLFDRCVEHWDTKRALNKVGRYLRKVFIQLEPECLSTGVESNNTKLRDLHEPYVGFKITMAQQVIGNCPVHNLMLALDVICMAYDGVEGPSEGTRSALLYQKQMLEWCLPALRSKKRRPVKRANDTPYNFVLSTLLAQQGRIEKKLATLPTCA